MAASTALLFVMTASAKGQTVVSDGAAFNQAINDQASSISLSPSSGGVISTVANSSTGNQGTVTYSSPFAGLISFSTTIEGNNQTLTGSGGATPLFIVSQNNESATGAVATPTAYTVSISNLNVSNGLSHGGSGANGGAGLGGALFAGAGATITLNNVSLTGNSAVGGAVDGDAFVNGAGGGGIGGNADKGGGGLFANSSDKKGGGANGGNGGIETGDNGGFGGGGGGASANDSTGGNGGFGAGGGLSGGNGGFGGGAGNQGEPLPMNGGFGGGGVTGGFGGGSSAGVSLATGGAGAGFGGGIFVQNKTQVLVTGSSTIAGNTVTAGNGTGGQGVDGTAAGSQIFMMTGSTMTLAPGTGNTITIGAASDDATGVVSAVADDSTYSVSGEHISTAGAGSGALLTIGSSSSSGGTVVLHGNNSYAGGTSITNGATLSVSKDGNLGAVDSGDAGIGAVSISGNSTLLTTADGFSSTRSLSLASGGKLAVVSGTTAAYNGAVTADVLTIGNGDSANQGTMSFGNASNSFGGIALNAGTLQVTSTGALGSGSGAISMANGTGLLAAADGLSSSRALNVTGSVSLSAASGTTATFSGPVTGGALIVGSTSVNGTIALTGTNTYSGGTSINGGTLKISSDASLGNSSTAVNFSNASELLMDFSGTINSSRALVINGGGTLAVTSGNSATVASQISGGTLTIGDGSVDHNGTVILTGNNTFGGNTRIDRATLQASSDNNLGQGDVQFFNGGKLLSSTNGASFSRDAVVDTTGTLAAATGTTMTYSGRIAGGALTVGDNVHNGTVILSGDNSYFGSTTVNSGTLLVNGTLSEFSQVHIESSATLGGSGTVAEIILENAAVLAPGNSIGTLNAESLTWNAGGKLAFELGNGASDRLALSGALNKSGSGSFSFDFVDADWQIGQTYTLVEFGSSNFSLSDFNYSNGDDFAGNFTLSGNSLTFQVTAVPEPGTWMLLVAGLLVMGWGIIRRKVSSSP